MLPAQSRNYLRIWSGQSEKLSSVWGDGVKKPTGSEKKIAKVVAKRIVADRDIQKEEALTADNLCVKRNDDGLRAG